MRTQHEVNEDTYHEEYEDTYHEECETWNDRRQYEDTESMRLGQYADTYRGV